MMPAASNKIEAKPSIEGVDFTKQFLNLLDKKVRNIEKRKSKLDTVRAKEAAGDILEKEQKEAVTHYEAVLVNLDFARELQKNFNVLAVDIEKQQKKQGKREKSERAAAELKRLVEVLQVQTTLDSLGAENVRQHFKTGKHGAVVLTEDNLTALDELYQLISPSRDGEENFGDKLTAASEHFISLLESRDRPVVGSTYKELMELINLINGCGYFERAREAEEASTAEPVSEEVAEDVAEEEQPASVTPTPTDTYTDVPESDVQNNASMQPSASEVEETSLSHSQVIPTVVTQDAPNISFFAHTTSAPTPTSFQPPQTQSPPQTAPKVRPLPEIISSVRGTFSFLQDSEIEMDSPHIDPAVVAAQPMMRPANSQQSQQPSRLPAGFPAPPIVDQSLDSEGQDPLSLSQQSLTQSNLDFSSASQSSFAHPQTLPAGNVPDALFQSAVVEESSSTVAVQQQQQQQQQQHSAPHGMMGRGTGEPVNSQFELPPSIPLPPSQTQQDNAQMTTQEKKFQLNASATEFQSRTIYPPQSAPTMHNLPSQQPQVQLPSSKPAHPQTNQPDVHPIPPPQGAVNADFPSAANFAQAAGDFSQGTNNYQSGGFQQRGGRGGPGGYRGGQRGGRGGSSAGNGVQNGFNPRQPQNGNTRPGNRGGAPFQGFPRNDYRSDGYQGQGFNANGFGGPTSYQKRGGVGGQGFPRGAGNNRGGGGMRSGPPRGAPPPRGAGGNRGGMNRPNNQ